MKNRATILQISFQPVWTPSLWHRMGLQEVRRTTPERQCFLAIDGEIRFPDRDIEMVLNWPSLWVR
jgi:hypothetical protein